MCRFTVFAVWFIYCVAIGTKAQPCIPDPVENIQLAANGVLSWTASANCGKAQYNVLIETGGTVEYEYTLDVLTLNLNFLKLCKPYTITVAPVADHILGGETSIEATRPLPTNVNIPVTNFTSAQVGEDVLIQWLVNENYTDCVTYYHLETWNEDSTDSESLYIGQTAHIVEHVAQCMNYRFEITVYYGDRHNAVQKFTYTVPPKTNTPSLVYLRQGPTVINSTWKLEPYHLNRCKITDLLVNGTHFNQGVKIVDGPARLDVDVSITGLKPNSLYYFAVATQNSAGISSPFKLAVQTVSEDAEDASFD